MLIVEFYSNLTLRDKNKQYLTLSIFLYSLGPFYIRLENDWKNYWFLLEVGKDASDLVTDSNTFFGFWWNKIHWFVWWVENFSMKIYGKDGGYLTQLCACPRSFVFPIIFQLFIDQWFNKIITDRKIDNCSI